MSSEPVQAIRVGVIGIGNCASALIQGVALARTRSATLNGVTYADIGGYSAADIEFVAAWDVDARKVGTPMAEAIFAPPNCCMRLVSASGEELASLGSEAPIVEMAPILDGVAPHMLTHPVESESFRVSDAAEPSLESVVALLKERRIDVLVNYLPVGSQEATEWWVNACLAAGVAFCNCIPVFIASDPAWEAKFVAARLPIIGDDMRSQFGASVLSQMLQELAFDRGHDVKAHIQQNVGGNTDFLNMLDKSRLASKKISKENVIRSQNDIRGVPTDGSFLFAGPSDYISHYGDNKIATFRLELEGFGGAPVTLDARLSVQVSVAAQPRASSFILFTVTFHANHAHNLTRSP